MDALQIENTADQLEGLLRIELAASEAYKWARQLARGNEHAPTLKEFEREHAVAAGSIRNLLARLHGPMGSAGLGEVGAAAVEKSTNRFGDRATFSDLHGAEDLLLRNLSRIVEDPNLAVEARRLITDQLLPAAQRRTQYLAALGSRRVTA